MGNEISINKSTIWKGSAVVLIIALTVFLFKGGNDNNSLTGNVIGASADGIVDVKITIKNFQYSPDTITVKKGSTVRLTIENK
ncbi:MAG: cupredoxin domain-containing protein, partial [Chloroflexi bacterium]|nr:cupredoxin domain-containing protein [Chloroflexota bacterium]